MYYVYVKSNRNWKYEGKNTNEQIRWSRYTLPGWYASSIDIRRNGECKAIKLRETISLTSRENWIIFGISSQSALLEYCEKMLIIWSIGITGFLSLVWIRLSHLFHYSYMFFENCSNSFFVDKDIFYLKYIVKEDTNNAVKFWTMETIAKKNNSWITLEQYRSVNIRDDCMSAEKIQCLFYQQLHSK